MLQDAAFIMTDWDKFREILCRFLERIHAIQLSLPDEIFMRLRRING